MKIKPELLNAYNNTIAAATKHGKSEFQCKGLDCKDCPFRNCDGYCDVGKSGGGVFRTLDEWNKWFDALDTASDELVGKTVTSYTVSRTTLHVEAPIERQIASFEELLAELDEFKKDIAAWVQVMNWNASKISIVIPDYMEFHAINAEGNCVIDWTMSADDFGKKKVWIEV